MGGFRNCLYIYIDLTYCNSLKTYLDFGSVELYGMSQGNMTDFLVFSQAIIYIGSGYFSRKISHCSSAKAHKHSRKAKPQQVHKNGIKIQKLKFYNFALIVHKRRQNY